MFSTALSLLSPINRYNRSASHLCLYAATWLPCMFSQSTVCPYGGIIKWLQLEVNTIVLQYQAESYITNSKEE